MNIRVVCPQDSWPNPPTSNVLPNMRKARQWAEWGHFCVRADLHEYIETDEPVTVTLTGPVWSSDPTNKVG